MMTTTDEAPRIYVASLTDYNAGRLRGVWIDLDGDDPDTLANDAHETIRAMLAEGQQQHPADGPYEEWAVHDFEGFHGFDVSEWCDLEQLARWAVAINEHGPAVAAYLANGYDLDSFEDDYRGEWDSEADYAEEFARETGAVSDDMAWPLDYIDWERVGRDMFIDSHWSADAPGCRIYAFWRS